VLALCFTQEQLHRRLIGQSPVPAAGPVRVAYAVRWIELRTGLRLPPWNAWFRSSRRDP
jgi:hypothetical protein